MQRFHALRFGTNCKVGPPSPESALFEWSTSTGVAPVGFGLASENAPHASTWIWERNQNGWKLVRAFLSRDPATTGLWAEYLAGGRVFPGLRIILQGWFSP